MSVPRQRNVVRELDELRHMILTLKAQATEDRGGFAVGAHASRHENGGDDEIDVTGLSGVLADPQTVAVDAAGALDGTGAAGDPLAVRVDGVTIQVNGSNNLQVIGSSYTDEQAQDAVGGILDDGGDIDFTYDDATPKITAVVKSDAVTNAKLANMAADTIKGRANGAGTGDPTDLTANEVSTVLDGATDPFVRTSDLPSPSSGEFEILLSVLGNEPPASNPATPSLRNSHPTLAFDGATDEEGMWTRVLPTGYGGGGLTLDTWWSFTSATSGNLRVQAAIERINTSGLDIDADSFASFNSAGGTAPGTSGQAILVTITFASGSEMDSLVAGELFRLKIRRDADGTSGTDDITTDAELLFATLRET